MQTTVAHTVPWSGVLGLLNEKRLNTAGISMSASLCLLLFYFSRQVFKTGYPGSHSVGWAGLKYRDLPATCSLRCVKKSVCVCAQSGTCKDQQRPFDPLELEVKVVLSHPTWELGPKSCSSESSSQALSHLSSLLSS